MTQYRFYPIIDHFIAKYIKSVTSNIMKTQHKLDVLIWFIY